MKNIWILVVFLTCIHSNSNGQIPKITMGGAVENEDSISPHIFWGTFCIDSIYEMGCVYLITVISEDTIKTTSSLMLGPGVPFTVISFKNGARSNEYTICKGGIYYFTLSPPDGVWTLFSNHYDDWKYSQSVQDPMGNTIKVPLPLIKTQLMLSSELNGLQYIHNNQVPASPRYHYDCHK